MANETIYIILCSMNSEYIVFIIYYVFVQCMLYIIVCTLYILNWIKVKWIYFWSISYNYYKISKL